MIDTPRLHLRPLTLDDAEAFHVIWGDPAVIFWGAKEHPDESREFLATVIGRTASRDELAWFAMVRRADAALVGDVLLQPAPWNPAVVEIGWHVAKDAQGEGYATEGAAGLLRHAVAHGIDHIEAAILPDNEPSRRVAQKLGMHVAGQIVHAGMDHDLWAIDLGADVLREQQEYYNARAPEYDDWFYRRGRYDRGAEANAAWLREVAAVEQALADFAPLGDVVELAAGTGLWTRWLAPLARSVTAVDGSAEMLEHNRRQAGAGNVERIQADLFDWQPPRTFDEVFMGFWLSHVPPERLDAFWRFVVELVGGAGRFFFVDSLYTEASTATDHELRGSDATAVTRRLDDGREFQIVKVFHDPAALQGRLEEAGWRAHVATTGQYFLYGYGER